MNSTIHKNVSSYKRKYYLNLLIKGIIISISFLLIAFLFYVLLEYFAHFNTVIRTILFYSYIFFLIIVFIIWIGNPLIRAFIKNLQISNEIAANQIGDYFPQISDKLLNIIQLYNFNREKSDLITASIQQKSSEIGNVDFKQAIHFKDNRRYLTYLALPFILVFFLSSVTPDILQEGTERIVKHNEEFAPKAPYEFVLISDPLIAYKNEDFKVELKILGEYRPENVFIITRKRKIKLIEDAGSNYRFTFQKVLHDIPFKFEAVGYFSANYKIEVVNRPNIKNFEVRLEYPAYLAKIDEHISNTGNFKIPEGTKATWLFNTIDTDSILFSFPPDSIPIRAEMSDNQLFTYNKLFKNTGEYDLKLYNRYSTNKERIRYRVEVIPDKFPQINLNQFKDTVLYEFLILGGNINDDYGFRDLNLHYRITTSDQDTGPEFKNIRLTINPNKPSQSFYYNWELSDFNLAEGNQIEYYLEVRDNDAINGSKSTRTGTYLFRIPDEEEIRSELAENSKNTENQIEKSLKKSRELNEKLEELESRLKSKKDLNWQDEEQIKKLLKEKQQLEEEIKKLQESYKAENLKRERFTEQDQRIMEKTEQLRELMDELLDEETKKLYEELQRLLEEKIDPKQFFEQMNKIKMDESTLEKELERALELYKRLKYMIKAEEVLEDIKKMDQEQSELSEETEDKNNDLDKIGEKQDSIRSDFEEVKKSMEELLDMNQDLKYPNRVEDTSEEEKGIEEMLDKAEEEISKGKRKNAGKAQRSSAQEMKNLGEKMEKMMASGQMMTLQENMDDLRSIMDNLVKLSFNQEDLMNEFKQINQSDPRFVDLSQKQLDLKDDAKIVEDSLLALANRVMQISSFVTREVGDMNKNLDESVNALKERNKNEAVGKQQFTMTSMNNLAIMLDDVLTQMQQQMAEAMGMPSNEKNGNQKSQTLSELQKQLSDRIQQLKNGGKQGRQLSEELSRLAAEQERLRKKMQEIQEKALPNQNNGGNFNDIIEKMEESELDLVNKRLTEELIKRQQDILTRLLEAEDAMREREIDPEREGEAAKQVERTIPEIFEEYLKAKEKEVELLKTIPPKLNPFYKSEVNEYFKRLEPTIR